MEATYLGRSGLQVSRLGVEIISRERDNWTIRPKNDTSRVTIASSSTYSIW